MYKYIKIYDILIRLLDDDLVILSVYYVHELQMCTSSKLDL